MKRFRLDTLIGFVKGFVTLLVGIFSLNHFCGYGFATGKCMLSGSIALVLVGIATNANSMIQDLLAEHISIADHDFKVGAQVKSTISPEKYQAWTLKKQDSR